MASEQLIIDMSPVEICGIWGADYSQVFIVILWYSTDNYVIRTTKLTVE